MTTCSHWPRRGLYLITNNDPFEMLLQKLAAALATQQVALLQYRRKMVALAEQPAEISAILKLTEHYKVPLIINDDVMLAQQFGVGVHLGQSDGSVVEARICLGDAAIIGRTCAQSLVWAHEAAAQSASYVAFGAVYPTRSKPEAQTLNLNILKHARSELSLPICTIGGLTVENATAVLAQGSDLCAVIGDVLDRPVPDVAARVHAWAAQFALQSTGL